MEKRSSGWGSSAWLLAFVVSLAGCNDGYLSPSAPANEGGPSPVPRYSGPFYTDVRQYVSEGTPFDFSHGLSDAQAAEGVQVAEEQVQGLSDSFEVGLIAAAGLPSKDDPCGGQCAEIVLVDYIRGQTHTVFVDLTDGTVAADTVQDGVLAPVGEQGLRELYGVALADSSVVGEVGEAFVVQPIVAPFSRAGTSCGASNSLPHRCVSGIIYTPNATVYVDVDLTSASLIRSDREGETQSTRA